MTNDGVRCSFCGKSEREVAQMLAGQSAYICDRCVDICHEAVTEERSRGAKAGPTQGGSNPPGSISRRS